MIRYISTLLAFSPCPLLMNQVFQFILFHPVYPVQFFQDKSDGVRPLDSAVAPLGVTQKPAVIPTEATNSVSSGTDESR